MVTVENSFSESFKKFTKTNEELQTWPDFIEHRNKIFERAFAEYKAEIAAKPRNKIKITLPDGKLVDGISWETTPLNIAASISHGLADNAVISLVNGELWDLERPLETDTNLSILKFDNDLAKQVYWHSSAHILGEACERFCGCYLCYGPPIADGFYYDMYTENYTVTRDDLLKLEKISQTIIKDKQPFERLEMKKEDLLEMFNYNKFKVRILEKKITTPTTTVYKCGPLIDLCRGPHVRDTGKIKALTITKSSCSHWEGNTNAESLQRIYGISFPDTKQLKEWKQFQEEAAKRDHRKIGIEQELYFFNGLSPGSAFWYPKGAYIYNTLVEFIREEYRKRGFNEVITPNLYNSKLWKKSGHWEHYSDDMFRFEIEKDEYGLKPMNCPGHCLMFDSKPHAYNQLPIRYADFGVLHRNEMSGALSGLTRVRRFQQDDAHIFCRPDQISDEIIKCLDFLNYVYVKTFGFTFSVNLSTRPELFLGEIDTWNYAEEQLKKALDNSGYLWQLNEGDGAFYGPKIDIKIKDALKRLHQTGTIQLDFQLPNRFDLHYFDENKVKHRPVMIHRAVLGSIERMTGILAENFGGKWPFWLSPRQLIIITVHKSVTDYANEVYSTIYNNGFEIYFDEDSSDTLNKRIRTAQLAQYNYILVIGQTEQKNRTVNVRTRDNQVRGEIKLDEFIKEIKLIRKERKNSESLVEQK